MFGDDREYWRGRNIQQNLDRAEERRDNQKAQVKMAGAMAAGVAGLKKQLDDIKRERDEALLQAKLQKCETAASNAQIAALKQVVNGEITRYDLNRVIGKDKNGEDQTEFGRIAKDAAFAKADELGVKREIIADWWFC